MQKYKLTKAIRFKLNPVINTLEIPKSEFSLIQFRNSLSQFLKDLECFLHFEKEITNKDGVKTLKKLFNKKLKIKNEWLKIYAKQERADRKPIERTKDKPSRVVLTISYFDVKTKDENGKRYIQNPVADLIKTSFEEIKAIYTALAKDASAENENRARREQTALLIKRLHTKKGLPLFFSLVRNASNKEEVDNLSQQLEIQARKLAVDLLSGLQEYLPSQSSGLPIAKASFNFYTINKRPVDFTDKKNQLARTLSVSLDNFKLVNSTPAYWELIKADVAKFSRGKTLLLGNAPMLEEYSASNSISLRQILKNIKAKQKAAFNELMQQKMTYDDFCQIKANEYVFKDGGATPMYLFKDIGKGQYDSYFELTQKIEKIATDLSDQKGKLSEDEKEHKRSNKEKLAKERGNLLKETFANWKNFAEVYRKVAQNHGKTLASLKGIEKEQTESQLIKYWALLLGDAGAHKLVLIPKEQNSKEKAKECKAWLEMQAQQPNNTKQVYWLESFTYRSLQKLCFGHVENGSNTFNKSIQYLLPTEKDKYGNSKPINGEFAFEGDEQRKIKFYIEVLKSQAIEAIFSKKALELVRAQVCNKSFSSMDDFQIELEKICYRRNVTAPANIEDELKKYSAQIFEITNYDLREDNKSFSKLKHHTEIWNSFWEQKTEGGYDVRLNPEITISYREPKSSRVAKYGENSTKKNRYLRPQFTLISTISEHCNTPTKVLSFIADDEYAKQISEFNNKIPQSAIKFAFGIDNGETELSTLGVYLPALAKNINEERISELQKVADYGFKVLTIRDLNHSEVDKIDKERKIIQNPSSFLKKENYMRFFNKTEAEYNAMFTAQFEEKMLLTLDLTTAKVICGHIVTNGDTPTLLKLWLRHAERNVYDMNDHTADKTAKRVCLKTFFEWNDKETNKLKENLGEKTLKSLSQAITKEGSKVANCIAAVAYIEEEIVDIRVIFIMRKDFALIKSLDDIIHEINRYNTNRTSHDIISAEELDFKMLDIKKALVANAIGVIDFLYKGYKERFKGEGLITKEGFATNDVAKGLEKFSGNIYRILEKKLYQKFQNYGLVPPIKNLMAVRAEGINDAAKEFILRLGNIGFVSKSGTSQDCPVCLVGRLDHTTTCPKCALKIDGIMHSNDGIAGYNIAKRGYNNFGNNATVQATTKINVAPRPASPNYHTPKTVTAPKPNTPPKPSISVGEILEGTISTYNRKSMQVVVLLDGGKGTGIIPPARKQVYKGKEVAVDMRIRARIVATEGGIVLAFAE